MKKLVLILLPIFILSGCASGPSDASFTEQRDLLGPLLQTEFYDIIESAPQGSRVGVYWCFDLRFGPDVVSSVSDWVQRQIERLLVDSGRFVMVTRRHLDIIQREQDLQISPRMDESTAISNTRNLGLSYLVLPEITRTGTLSIQSN